MLAPSNASRTIRAGIWLAYTALIILITLHHEYSRDEIDTWTMVKYANLKEFIGYFSYSGHPPLWYLVNLPLVRWLGLPMEAISVVPIISASTLVWLLLFRSTLPLWLLLPCIFSVHLIFQYSVFARGYPLMLCLLFLTVALHATRFSYPLRYGGLLGLLFMTELFAWPATGILTLFFMYDCWQRRHGVDRTTNQRQGAAIYIALFSLFIALALLWPQADKDPRHVLHFALSAEFFPHILRNGFIPINHFSHMLRSGLPVDFVQFLTSFSVSYALTALVVIIFLLSAAHLWRRRAFWLFAAWSSGCFFIYCFVYSGHFWHWGLMPMFLVFTCWFAEADAPWKKDGMQRLLYGLMAAAFSAAALISAFVTAYEVRSPYSGAPNVASFLETETAQHTPVIAIGCHHALSIAAYLPEGSVWLASQQRFTRLYRWDYTMYQCMNTSVDTMIRRGLAHFPNHKRLWFVVPKKLNTPYRYGLVERYFSPGFLERYWVYEKQRYRVK